METMARGAARIVIELHGAGRLDGILALGGSGGTAVATEAMRALPVGVPKLMVSTVAAGNVDLTPAVIADIEGVSAAMYERMFVVITSLASLG